MLNFLENIELNRNYWKYNIFAVLLSLGGQALMLYFNDSLYGTGTQWFILLSTISAIFYLLVILEVVRGIKNGDSLFIWILFLSLCTVVLFGFQYFMLDAFYPRSFEGLNLDVVSVFHMSLMNFVFGSTAVIPVSLTAKSLNIVQTIFSYIFFSYLLSHIWTLRKSKL